MKTPVSQNPYTQFTKLGETKPLKLFVLFHGVSGRRSSSGSKWETDWSNAMLEDESSAIVKLVYPTPFPKDLRVVARQTVDGILEMYDKTLPLTFVGHSMGGMIAMEALVMGLESGMKIECVALVATAGKATPSDVIYPDLKEGFEILDTLADSPTLNVRGAFDTMEAWARDRPLLQKFINSEVVRSFVDTGTEDSLLQIRTTIGWMLDGDLETGAAEQQVTPDDSSLPKVAIIAAGLDSVLPAKDNVSSIMSFVKSKTAISDSNIEFIMLTSSDHSMGEVFTGKDGAEYVKRCGDLSLPTKLRIGTRLMMSDPVHRYIALTLTVLILVSLVILVIALIISSINR